MTDYSSVAAPEFPLADINELPDDVRQHLLKVEEKAGFIPNAFLMLARRPAELRAFLAYYEAVTNREGGRLSKVDIEMITVVISALNGCHYCSSAHGAILRVYSRQPELPEALINDYSSAPIDASRKAMLGFAIKLAITPSEIRDEDYQALYEQGFDAEDIWDIAGVVGFFGFANRMAIVQGVEPNPEFAAIGR